MCITAAPARPRISPGYSSRTFCPTARPVEPAVSRYSSSALFPHRLDREDRAYHQSRSSPRVFLLPLLFACCFFLLAGLFGRHVGMCGSICIGGQALTGSFALLFAAFFTHYLVVLSGRLRKRVKRTINRKIKAETVFARRKNFALSNAYTHTHARCKNVHTLVKG